MEQEKKKSKLKIIIPIVVIVIVAVVFITIIGSVIITVFKESNGNNNLQDGMFTSTFKFKVHTIMLDTFGGLGLNYDTERNLVYYGKPIGSYVIQEGKGNKIASIIMMIKDDTKKYREMMIATFLAVDDKLTYDEANEISKTLENDALFNGGNGVEKNGIKYEYLRTSTQDGNTFYEWVIMPINADT